MSNLKINFNAFLFFFRISPKYWFVFFTSRFLAVFNSFFDLFMTAILLNQFNTDINIKNIFYILILLLIVKLLINVLNRVLSYFNTVYSKEFADKENLLFIDKFLHINYSEMEGTNFRQLRRTISETANFGYGRHAFIQTLQEMIDDVFSIIISVFLFAKFFVSLICDDGNLMSVWLFFVIFVFISIRVISNNYAINKSNELMTERIEGFVDCNRVEDSVNSYHQGKDIRLYRQSEYILKIKREIFLSWKTIWSDICAKRCTYATYATIVTNLETIFTNLILFYFVFIGKMLPGSYVSNLGYVSKFSEALCSVSANVSMLKNNTEHIARYLSFFDYVEIEQSGVSINNCKFENYITFNNVSFKYPDCDETVLNNITCNIMKGKKYAIVGQNGSGKSTFIKLLCRLYEPESGYIQIDDLKANSINLEEYWSAFSIIFQDFNLFAFSLGQNIAVNYSASEKDLLPIIEKACFLDRYKNMEEGMDTLLYKNFDESGVEISGGEAQKIALSRAIYKNGDIFVLDEPTAALDPIAESELYQNFNAIAQDKTVIYISHRLASCKFCDEIMVFDNGKIVQIGTHESLLKDVNGKYYELWRAQADHYKI